MGKIITLDNLRKKDQAPEKPIRVAFSMINPTPWVNLATIECLDALLVHSAHQRLPDGRCKYEIIRINKPNATNVFDGRNKLCEGALENDADYILMIDSDMIFPPESLERLIKHDKDVISALATKKVEPYAPVMAVREKEDGYYGLYKPLCNWVRDALIKVDGVGTAFLLIKTEVFKNLPKPWFSCPWLPESEKHLGSDYFFSGRVNEHGFETWVDTSLTIGHTGHVHFDLSFFEAAGGPVKERAETKDPSTEYDTYDVYKEKLEARKAAEG